MGHSGFLNESLSGKLGRSMSHLRNSDGPSHLGHLCL
jgi:hypothetical protein